MNRRRSRPVRPRLEGLEAREAPSAGGIVRTAIVARSGRSAAPRLNGQFNGTYTVASGTSALVGSMIRLSGPGNAAGLGKARVDSIVATPAPGTDRPALGILQVGKQGDTADDRLLLRLQADSSGAKSPAPARYSWSVDPHSSGAYAGATGQGTVQLRFQTSRGATTSATGSFKLTINGSLTRPKV